MKIRGFVFNVNGSTIECKFTKKCINDCTHRGRSDDDVAFWVKELRSYLDKIPADLIRRCLKSYGAWNDEELQDDEENLHRFIWCATGQAKDNEKDPLWATMDV